MGLNGVSPQQLTPGWNQVNSMGEASFTSGTFFAQRRCIERRYWLPVFRTINCREQLLSAHGRLERVLNTGSQYLPPTTHLLTIKYNISCNMKPSIAPATTLSHNAVSAPAKRSYCLHWCGSMVALVGPLATINCEPRQTRKGAAAAIDSGAGVWRAGVTTEPLRNHKRGGQKINDACLL